MLADNKGDTMRENSKIMMRMVAFAIVGLSSASLFAQAQVAAKVTPPATTAPAVKPVEEDPLLSDSLDAELAKQNFGQKIEVIPTQIKLPKEAKLSIAIPNVGVVEFKPILNSAGVVQGFQSLFPQGGLDWGILKLEKGLFQIAGGKISYNAYALMMGKRAKVGLKEFALVNKDAGAVEEATKTGKPLQVYKLTLGIEFLEGAISFEIAPGRKFEVKNLDLIIEEKKGITFTSSSDAFGQPITVEGALDIQKKESFIKATVKARPIIELLPELKGTAIEGLSTEGTFVFKIITRQLTDDEKKKGMQQQSLIFRGNLTRDSAGTSAPITFLGITLQDATIVLDTSKKHAYIAGKSKVLELDLQSYFALFFGDKKGVKFVAEIAQGVKQWNPFKESPVQPLKELTVTDLKAGVRAQYLAAAQGKQEPAAAAGAGAGASEAKVAAAFEKITFGSPSDFEIAQKSLGEADSFFAKVEDVKLEGDGGASIEFYLSGKSKVLGVESAVTVKLDKAPQKNFGATLIGQLTNFKLSRLFPGAFDSANSSAPDAQGKKIVMDTLDLFELKYARVAVTTRKDSIGSDTIEPGFNLMAGVTLDAPSNNQVIIALKDVIAKASGGDSKPAALQLAGTFNPADPKNINLKVALGAGSLGFNLGLARFEGGRLYLVIKGEPAVGFGGGFKMIPAPGEQPLEFDLEFTATPVGFGGAGSMKNTWKNPFGIKGFEFGNLALRGTQTWSVVAEAIATGGAGLLVPATLGISGDVRIGKGSCESGRASDDRTFCSKLRLNVGKDLKELAVVLDVDNPPNIITFFTILLEQMNAPAHEIALVQKLMPLQLSKAKLYFVPLGTNIGAINVDQGIGAAIYVNMFGYRDAALLDCMISLKEIIGKGKLRGFELGPIKLTNYDDTCDLSTGGFKTPPALPKLNPNDALAEVRQAPKLACGPEVDLTLSLEKEPRFVIDGLMKLGDLFQSKTKWFITKDGIGFDTETFIGPAEAKLGVRLKGTSIPLNDIGALAKLQAKDIFVEIEFKDSLTQKIRDDIAKELQRNKEKFERDINDVIEQLGRNTALEDIGRQEKRVEEFFNRRISWINDPIESTKREFEWRGEQLKLEMLRAKYAIEQTQAGQELKKVVNALGIDKLAQNVLFGFKKIGVGGIEGAQFVFKEISRVATVRRAYWKGTAADLATGVIPGITIELCAGCQLITHVSPPFDIKDPTKSIDAIAKSAMGVIEKAIIATFKTGACSTDPTCAVPVGPASAPENPACTALQEHIKYWTERGERDEEGNVYDGDWNRGQKLLEACRIESPTKAKELESQMLLGKGCRELMRHVRYWEANGKGFDNDAEKGRQHFEECAREKPEFAQKLAQRLLPSSACRELREHGEYWRKNGGIDKDPTRRRALIERCRASSPSIAKEIEASLPPLAA